jgi:hypothetical protein
MNRHQYPFEPVNDADVKSPTQEPCLVEQRVDQRRRPMLEFGNTAAVRLDDRRLGLGRRWDEWRCK